MEEGKGRVCVTGGTGFIASMIIKRLLLEGYSINTTIRFGPGKSNKDVSFLTNLPGASQKLQVFNADLNNPQSFDAAIEGCIGVFHVATVIDLQKDESVEILTKRAIGGALGILKASINSKTVKRVIYTGSSDAVINSGKEAEELDESYWSDVDFMYKTKPLGWTIAISHTLVEKAVLEFGEQHGVDVVTLVLPLVIGPFICSKLPDAVQIAFSWLFGVYQFDVFLRFPTVHVDDLARAYIFLLEHPNPKGRYICSLSGTVTFEEIAELVHAKYPEFQIPTLDSLKETKGWEIPSLSSKKLIEAGFEFKYGIKEIFEETIHCCKEKGKSKKDVSFLTNLPSASQNLQIFNANLNNPANLRTTIEGCIGVFHVATPIDFQQSESQEMRTKRTVDGALGILKASINSETVKRVVYTLSNSVVIYSSKDVEERDESYWSNVDFIYKTKPFDWSCAIYDTLAEKEVLEFGEQHGCRESDSSFCSWTFDLF